MAPTGGGEPSSGGLWRIGGLGSRLTHRLAAYSSLRTSFPLDPDVALPAARLADEMEKALAGCGSGPRGPRPRPA